MVEVPVQPAARQWSWLIPVAIGVVAFAVRLMSAMHSGGLDALFGYDEGVYFGASTSWVSGLMPYRDFALVHPPGSVVLLSPFAALGRVTSEPTAWMIARLAIMLLGAFNAVLVYLVARRVNLVAGIVAGGMYAVWAPVVHVERTTMLEVFVLTSILVALWALHEPRVSTSRLILAGAALGVGVSTKLWGLVPLLVILGWLLVVRAWRSAAIVAGAATVAILAIVLPFFLKAPQQMIDLVIRAQISRGRGGTRKHDRLVRMFSLDVHRVADSMKPALVIGITMLLIVLIAMAIVWTRAPRGRVWVVLLFVQLAVLMAVPVYFEGYSSFIGPALMLVVGSAVGIVWVGVGSRPHGTAVAIRTVLAVCVVAAAMTTGYRALRAPVDLKPKVVTVAEATNNAQCVGSDSAGVLLLANVLSRNIDRGCPTVIDFDGLIYTFDDGNNPNRLSSTKRRRASAAYQQAMRDYFAANDVLLIHRPTADAFDQQTRKYLHSRPLLSKQHGLRAFGPATGG